MNLKLNRMKKLSLIVLLVALSGAIFAQQTITFDDYANDEKVQKNEDDQQIQTLMNSFEIKRISGFGGPTMSYTTINGEFAFMMGGGGGIIINNLFLGGYGEGLSNTIDVGGNNLIRNLEFGHGGFWVGYEIAPQRMIHPVISSRVGWGEIRGASQENGFIKDNVFVLIPTVSAEINFTQFFKVNVGAEYRQTLNVNAAEGITNKDFSNVGVYMNFVFGWF